VVSLAEISHTVVKSNSLCKYSNEQKILTLKFWHVKPSYKNTFTSSWKIFSWSARGRYETIGPKFLAQEFRIADHTSVTADIINL
jgi:hypothetical protein